VFFAWCFAGEVVVIRMVDVVRRQLIFCWLKVRQRAELYFSAGLSRELFLSETNTKAQWPQRSGWVYC
jgi:hypothetical protein